MSQEDIGEKIARLRAEVARHEYLYRVENQPEISDQEYDRMLAGLRALEQEYPLFAAQDSPTRTVGDDRIAAFENVRHLQRMLSLDNTYSQEELLDFDRRLRKLLQREELSYHVEPKIDGLAISVIYRNGVFERAVTRGNGEEGDDVSANVRTIRTLPHRLNGEKLPQLLEVRGEIYLTQQEFDRINRERGARGEERYMNPRNLASGTIKQLDSRLVANRKLEIVLYGLGAAEGYEPSQQHQLREDFVAWGLPTVERSWRASGIEEVWQAVEELNEMRLAFTYPTDGAVIKLDDIRMQGSAGVTSKAPRWAISYKFAAEQAETQLRTITLQLGRTGVITPVAELDPVEIAGSIVSRATLHNEDEIRRKDIREGDWVVVEKAGEIIPAVVRVLTARRPAESVPFDFPGRLDELGWHAERVEGQAAWRISAAENPAVLRRQLQHFAGRTAMDIDGLGRELIRQLVDTGKVKDIADLYALQLEDLLGLEKVAEKSATNLLQAIDQSRQADLWRLLHGLGIPHVGAEAAKLLARHFRSMEGLQRADTDQLENLNGIGAVMAQSIREYLQHPAHSARIQRLREEFGFKMETEIAAAESGGPLQGKTFVITGTLPNLSREEAKQQIEAAGGKVSSAVSAKTNYLIAGESAGSKLTKANALSVPVLSEADLLELLHQ